MKQKLYLKKCFLLLFKKHDFAILSFIGLDELSKHFLKLLYKLTVNKDDLLACLLAFSESDCFLEHKGSYMMAADSCLITSCSENIGKKSRGTSASKCNI